MAGEMMSNGDYAPETLMSSLSEEGQLAFCEALVARAQAADAAVSEADQMTFINNTCLLAGVLGGATTAADCEAAQQGCLEEFANATVSVENCLADFAGTFQGCNATVSDVEGCEVATREQLLEAMLNLNFGTITCDIVENPLDPRLLPLLGQLPTDAPAECSGAELMACQEIE